MSRKSTKTFLTPNNEADKIRKAVEDAAATRIQAAFRSFLVRLQTRIMLATMQGKFNKHDT